MLSSQMPSDTLYDWALPLKSPALASCCHGFVSDLESHRALIASHLNVNQPKIFAPSSYAAGVELPTVAERVRQNDLVTVEGPASM